eukprot:m.127564 g.127564  ORF g.127564 m.127564 type:complete len:146 (+) comp14551_c0_seq1:743-1180(+)
MESAINSLVKEKKDLEADRKKLALLNRHLIAAKQKLEAENGNLRAEKEDWEVERQQLHEKQDEMKKTIESITRYNKQIEESNRKLTAKTDAETGACGICTESTWIPANLSCGHQKVCFDCAASLKNSDNEMHCPECFQYVTVFKF